MVLLKNLGPLLDILNKAKEELAMSNYGPKGAKLYSVPDNSKRKMNNTGDVLPSSTNSNFKAYTTSVHGSAKQQADKEAKRYATMNRKSRVKQTKDFTPEELAVMNDRYKKVAKEEPKEITSEPIMPIMEGKEKLIQDAAQKKLKDGNKTLELIDFNKHGQWSVKGNS